MNKEAVVYLIPAPLSDDGLQAIHPYCLEAIRQCSDFFVENERTTRRYFKQLWKEMIIDDYGWYTIHKTETDCVTIFRDMMRAGKTVGIVSEAGCPGIADPGQLLVAAAQDMKAVIKPLVGPNSILLALMASGFNGQRFNFRGYLPIDNQEKIRQLKAFESESVKRETTQIFIETPYRNNQLIDALLQNCQPDTRLCIAVDLTGEKEWIRTLPLKEWKLQKPDIHKIPAIFLLMA
ncbi:MAG: SAM-dependent methyltransferase [Terrimonas sp.]|nr:SAM-dependent methyltransferase [Terrimonas sp.]